MTAIAEIIEQAFREGRLVNELQNPTPTQVADAMKRLQQVIGNMYGVDAGENLNDWPLGPYGRNNQSWIGGAYFSYPELNSRILATATEAKNVYLPVSPSPGARVQIVDPFARLAAFPVTLDGNGRTIEGAATLVLNVNSTNRVWFYRDDLANWVRITALTVADEMPFPDDFDTLFVTLLALRIAPLYRNTLPPETISIMQSLKRDFVNRYLQSAPLQINPDLAYPTQQSYDNYFWGFPGQANTADWNRGGGWPW